MADPRPTAVICGDLNLLRCFAGTGVPTLVLATSPDDPVLRSRYCRRREVIRSPASDAAGAIEDLCRLGRELQRAGDRPVLFYETDSMLLAISRHRDALAPYYRFLMPPQELVEQLVDKVAFSGLCRRLGFPLPKSLSPAELPRPEDVPAHLAFPVVLKPNVHIGWFGSSVVQERGGAPAKMLRADSLAEFLDLYPKVRRFTSDFVIQEYIPGGDDNIYSFHAYFDERGEPLGHHVGRKIRTYPKDSGLSTYLEIVKEPAVEALGLDLLRRLGFVGPIKIDFKRDAARGRYFILEFNPRFTLWNYLAARSGLNFPLIVYQDLTGQRPAPATCRPGLRWLAFDNDLRAFLKCYRPAGDLTLARWLGSLASRKVYDVFAWDDPYPFLVSTYQYTQHLARRFRRSAAPGAQPAAPRMDPQ